jgi:hypothetical protein
MQHIMVCMDELPPLRCGISINCTQWGMMDAGAQTNTKCKFQAYESEDSDQVSCIDGRNATEVSQTYEERLRSQCLCHDTVSSTKNVGSEDTSDVLSVVCQQMPLMGYVCTVLTYT